MQHRKKRMSCWTPPRVRARKTPPTTSQRNQGRKGRRLESVLLGLLKKVAENEQTEPTLHDKVSSLVDSLLASGLNEPTFLKRKENIKKPKNCKLLRVTKVNSEIWDIAQKTTRSMDARSQKVQHSLVSSVIPIARLMGTTGEVIEKNMQCLLRVNFGKAYPTRYFWEASAKHDLNMCRRDLFKAGLDDTCKAICGSKQPVGLELFGDDLTDQLKTVKESNKAAKQLTFCNKRKSGEEYSRSSYSARSFFF